MVTSRVSLGPGNTYSSELGRDFNLSSSRETTKDNLGKLAKGGRGL